MASSTNNEISFKPPVIIYLIQKASTNVLFKLCKCNKRLKELIKSVRGYYADLVYIADDYSYVKDIPAYPFSIKYGSLIGEFKIADKNLNKKTPLKVLNQLCLYLKRKQKFNDLLLKLDLTAVKRIVIKEGYLDSSGFMRLFNPSTVSVGFEFTVIEGCDALKYILSNCLYITHLRISWQPHVTSFVECVPLHRQKKLEMLVLVHVTEYLKPEDVANFIINQMEEGSVFRMYYRMKIPSNYERTVQDLVPKKLEISIYGTSH